VTFLVWAPRKRPCRDSLSGGLSESSFRLFLMHVSSQRSVLRVFHKVSDFSIYDSLSGGLLESSFRLFQWESSFRLSVVGLSEMFLIFLFWGCRKRPPGFPSTDSFLSWGSREFLTFYMGGVSASSDRLAYTRTYTARSRYAQRRAR